jgi:ribonuclease-3
MDFSTFENKIGIKFNDQKLLAQAFTHRSYLNENPPPAGGAGLEHNERLEFLGDAVLELIVTEYLYDKYPTKAEGELTSYRAALVNATSLAALAMEMGMNDYLLLSKGEAKDTGRARQYILANAFEAVLGAIYLDQGYAAALAFVKAHLFPKVEEVVEKSLWVDPKSYFQERAQEVAGITPSYKVLSEEGPDHAKVFTVGVYLGAEMVAKGRGHSKQEAEQDAARTGLEMKNWK